MNWKICFHRCKTAPFSVLFKRCSRCGQWRMWSPIKGGWKIINEKFDNLGNIIVEAEQ